ncbi:MAG TPA: ABC transporter substrate-binding protein, partial [Devosia sp.]|nr:ABC transporter substrate-binding protein [Devosia sp.]
IVAHANVAAGLIPLGIRPVGIYVDGPVAEDMSLRGLDLTGIEILGEAWGEIDIEKLAAVEPDIIIAEYWPLEKAYSGMEAGAQDGTLIEQIAPVAGPAQGFSTEKLIEDYEALAALLGADLSDPAIAANKEKFTAAKAAFQEAVKAKPDPTVMAVSAAQDSLYVAEPLGASELADMQAWGLNLISPEIADDRGYWETLSWELADKHQPDLVIVDDRYGSSIKDILASKPTWQQSVRAAAAGQVTDWPAFWMRNYKVYAEELDKLTATISAADDTIGD